MDEVAILVPLGLDVTGWCLLVIWAWIVGETGSDERRKEGSLRFGRKLSIRRMGLGRGLFVNDYVLVVGMHHLSRR